MKVAINGFGRIGRLVLRRILSHPNLEVLAINDLTKAETLAHLFKYDSVHGKYEGEVYAKDGQLFVDGKGIKIFSEREPENLPWKELQIEAVLECTGAFRTRGSADRHIKAGAKRILISAPAKGGEVPFIVLGVNDEGFDFSETVISNSSCTTNCLAPMVKVLDDAFGIEKGYITTIHAYTGDQRLQDAPHRDLRRARAAALSMVPTTTGAAVAVGKVLPQLEGKLDGKAVRVPTADGSITDLVVILKNDTTAEEVNAAMKKAAEGPMKGILEYCVDPIVSIDIVGNDHSCIFDSQLTSAQGNLVKVFGWYDNEMGYAARMVDLAERVIAGE